MVNFACIQTTKNNAFRRPRCADASHTVYDSVDITPFMPPGIDLRIPARLISGSAKACLDQAPH